MAIDKDPSAQPQQTLPITAPARGKFDATASTGRSASMYSGPGRFRFLCRRRRHRALVASSGTCILNLKLWSVGATFGAWRLGQQAAI
jgi:hypothetical protein